MEFLYGRDDPHIAANAATTAGEGRSDYLESQLSQSAAGRARALPRLEGFSIVVAAVCRDCAVYLWVFPVV